MPATLHDGRDCLAAGNGVRDRARDGQQHHRQRPGERTVPASDADGRVNHISKRQRIDVERIGKPRIVESRGGRLRGVGDGREDEIKVLPGDRRRVLLFFNARRAASTPGPATSAPWLTRRDTARGCRAREAPRLLPIDRQWPGRRRGTPSRAVPQAPHLAPMTSAPSRSLPIRNASPQRRKSMAHCCARRSASDSSTSVSGLRLFRSAHAVK